MSKLFRFSLLISTLLTLSPLAPVRAEENTSESWEFSFIPFGWLARIDGQTTSGERTLPANITFSEIIDNLDFTLQGQLEATKGNWSLFFNGVIVDLSKSPEPLVAVSLSETIIELGARYRLYQWQGGALSALAGVRYHDLSVSASQSGQSASGGVNWVDPIIGLRSDFELSDRITLILRGDVGGFGAGSEFAWNTLGVLGYDLSPSTTFLAGYRVLGVDYQEGSGDSFFRFDATQKGPILGLQIRF